MASSKQPIAEGDSFIRKLSNLILYSSVWIGACSAALVTFTYDVTGSGILLDPYVGLVFCGTLVLYTMHHLSGIERLRKHTEAGRFAIIREYRSHILIYGIIGAAGGLYFLSALSVHLIAWLIVPGVLSFLYVVPLGKRKRWRDYHLVKIFLISGVWATLTGLIPFVHTEMATWTSGIILFFERVLFIFAITIPFDIRDIHIDEKTDLTTLPMVIGIRRSKVLALVVLGISALFTYVLIWQNVYDVRLMVPYAICLCITAILIWNSKPDLDDHYYSGLLDGTMFLLGFGYWIAMLLW